MPFKSFLKQTIKLIILLWTTVQWTSCSNEGCKPRDVEQYILDWGFFKKGTYWIYEEETLGITDSFWVFKDSSYFISIDPDNVSRACEQVRRSYITNINTQDTFYIRLSTFTTFVQLVNTKNPWQEGLATCPLTPQLHLDIESEQKIQDGSGEQVTVFDSFYKSYLVRGDTFNQVVRANNNFNRAYRETPTIFYFAKGKGLIRKDFPEYDMSWHLVRYEIVK
jgi:hypothetical protein